MNLTAEPMSRGGTDAAYSKRATELQSQRRRTQAELKRLDRAIAALRPLNSGNPGPERERKAKRTLSTATRRKIGAAQRARSAKLKKQRAAQRGA